jgi:hypothetical protein
MPNFEIETSDGTLTKPGQSFVNDTNTGRFRNGADNMRDVCGGTAIMDYTTTYADALVGLKVGSGAEVTKILKGTASYALTLAASASTTTTVTVTGAAVGDTVFVGYNAIGGGSDHILSSGYVSATNTVTVVFHNANAGSGTNLASRTLTAIVVQSA